tara:strand:+ start:8116 stop:8301 length:186 start_codon:yes stop_codon:yes gene_type:complete
MLEVFFIFLSYVIGTAMGLYFAKQKIKDSIEMTIDNLINQDFIQTEKKANGEVEIKKWYEK